MSSIAEHARRELKLCGQYDESPEYSESIIKAIEAFMSYGHSGGSAEVALGQFNTLMNRRSLSPITSDPEEWIDRSKESGKPFWQNSRDSTAFSEDGGKTWWFLSEKTTEEEVIEAAKEFIASRDRTGIMRSDPRWWGMGNDWRLVLAVDKLIKEDSDKE
ncbi:MAG TPA: hypothetical protein VIY48_11785 [Candidatus Paceibacterota bacterium]